MYIYTPFVVINKNNSFGTDGRANISMVFFKSLGDLNYIIIIIIII